MLSIIAAIASGNRALGKDNRLIYRIPADLARFKNLTSGHPVIMGRKTFESIGHPLSNRTNIVVTHSASLPRSHLGSYLGSYVVVHSLAEAIAVAKTSEGSEEFFIIGGGQVYQEAIGLADKLYLTIVEGNPDADTFFPEYENLGFKVVHEEKREEVGYKFRFVNLEK